MVTSTRGKSGTCTCKYSAISCPFTRHLSGYMKVPDAVLTRNLASLSLLHFPQPGRRVLATRHTLLYFFFNSRFYNFLSNKPSSRVNTKARIFSVTVFAGEVHALQTQAVCGFHVFPVVAPSSVLASGTLGVDFLGFSRYTATSDAKCD